MGQPQQPEGADAEEAAGTDSGAGTGPTGASASRPPLRVGMVGYAFMGAAHSQGWRTAGRVFDLPLNPVLAAICGRDADAVTSVCRRCAAGGAARRARQIIGVAGRAMHRVETVAAMSPFRRIGLADDDGAGFFLLVEYENLSSHAVSSAVDGVFGP